MPVSEGWHNQITDGRLLKFWWDFSLNSRLRLFDLADELSDCLVGFTGQFGKLNSLPCLVSPNYRSTAVNNHSRARQPERYADLVGGSKVSGFHLNTALAEVPCPSSPDFGGYGAGYFRLQWHTSVSPPVL
jgi:hypothetical protein